MWAVIIIGFGIIALLHTAPAPFLLDVAAGDRAVWHMPRDSSTVYFTFDDGPNPATTPDLLDVLAEAGVPATFTRVSSRLRAGDIVVMHDGDESAPRKDQRQTVEATRQLIPAVRERGFTFGTVCQNG